MPLAVIDNKLDKDWIRLMFKAKQLGITADEIKLFIEENKNK